DAARFCHNRSMTDNTQQGYDAGDVTALASVLAGGFAVLLTMFLPARDIGIAAIAIAATLGLAIYAGAHTRGRGTAWVARAGSARGVIALGILVVGQLVL